MAIAAPGDSDFKRAGEEERGRFVSRCELFETREAGFLAGIFKVTELANHGKESVALAKETPLPGYLPIPTPFRRVNEHKHPAWLIPTRRGLSTYLVSFFSTSCGDQLVSSRSLESKNVASAAIEFRRHARYTRQFNSRETWSD